MLCCKNGSSCQALLVLFTKMKSWWDLLQAMSIVTCFIRLTHTTVQHCQQAVCFVIIHLIPGTFALLIALVYQWLCINTLPISVSWLKRMEV